MKTRLIVALFIAALSFVGFNSNAAVITKTKSPVSQTIKAPARISKDIYQQGRHRWHRMHRRRVHERVHRHHMRRMHRREYRHHRHY